MDRQRSRAPALTGAAAFLLLVAGDVAAAPPLRDARWLAPGVPIATLARQPSSCLVMPRDEKAARAVTIGRVAFRTPLLLGGQAARVGLSCASCHRNGRGNPNFFFPGLSGAPGTADVTTSLLSSHRGDGIANPKPIPDLAAPERKRIITRDPKGRELENFIHGVIVEEFDGREPPPLVLHGLSAYVRAISPRSCGYGEKLSLGAHLGDADAALGAAAYAWSRGDRATARLMVAGARTALGLIDERYAPPALGISRRAIRDADIGLAAIQRGIDNGASNLPIRIAAWRIEMGSRSKALARDAALSLYNPKILATYGRTAPKVRLSAARTP